MDNVKAVINLCTQLLDIKIDLGTYSISLLEVLVFSIVGFLVMKLIYGIFK